jgi:hypothetical protein
MCKFATENGLPFAFFLLLLTVFPATGLTTGSFMAVSVNLTPLFFFSYTLYGEMVLIFAEPGLEVLA